MSDQAANGGVLYLKGDGVAAGAQARAGLRNPGPGFSLAGTASVVTQVRSAGFCPRPGQGSARLTQPCVCVTACGLTVCYGLR